MLLGGARRVAEIEIVPVTPKHAAVARPAPCAARRIPPMEGYRRCGRLPEALHTRVGRCHSRAPPVYSKFGRELHQRFRDRLPETPRSIRAGISGPRFPYWVFIRGPHV